MDTFLEVIPPTLKTDILRSDPTYVFVPRVRPSAEAMNTR
ncbi:MAG: hypothetical protein J07HQW2_00557 [Haloquadratum walsbyi J07HQW2]|uniref:Uncharacterized protein n=1 Tax=Haloquadratum walsbyi J07HQW2 TaxID=1238425 RepID=U1NBS8_9EURY|nr:MAG: hypothetical protein J07HQW2_00557 [Haloquadratum walsbyi J07HQW2]